MAGIFVAGTDTDVGKTTVAAGLLKLFHGFRQVRYWKPVQTGTLVGDDTAMIRELTDLGEDYVCEPVCRFPEPVAPLVAARKWHRDVTQESILTQWETIRHQSETVIVEGSGGMLVPMGEGWLQPEWVAKAKLPAILVAEDRLGAINQTLMTVETCRRYDIPLLGLILTKSRGQHGNEECIREFSKLEILASLPYSEDGRSVVANIAADTRLRALFQISALP